MNKHMSALMQKEMTRKEFLATIGFGIATVFGLGSLIRLLTGRQAESSILPSAGLSGYGANAYGGRRS